MTEKKPSLLLALVPILILITLLYVNVKIYGEDSSYGSNQIALLFAAFIAAVIGLKKGHEIGRAHV